MQHDILTRRSAVRASGQHRAGRTSGDRFVTRFTVLIERLLTSLSAALRGNGRPARTIG